jgi:Nucleotide modification associated domain 3
MNNALIIRVGANLKENKGLSPIFKDNTYEYIPSPLEAGFNINKHHNHRHYSKMNCQNNNLNGMHMSSFVNEGTGHVDPEFYTFTYGETRNPYITQLKKLKDGDILLFSMLLQKYDTKKTKFVLNGNPNIYIIGYFMITDAKNSIHEFNGSLSDADVEGFDKSCNEHIIYRSHHIHAPENKKLLLIQGDKHQSLLFKHPLKISLEETYLKRYIKNWGIEEISKTLNAQWCRNHENVKNEIFDHGNLNRWIEWSIP